MNPSRNIESECGCLNIGKMAPILVFVFLLQGSFVEWVQSTCLTARDSPAKDVCKIPFKYSGSVS